MSDTDIAHEGEPEQIEQPASAPEADNEQTQAVRAAGAAPRPTHSRLADVLARTRWPSVVALRARVAVSSPHTGRLVASVTALVVLLALVPAAFDLTHHTANATQAGTTPTATTQPPTPIPSPTAIAGYQPLVDRSDGFVIQRPLAWSCSPSHPGVDCMDSPDEQNYRLQVQLPGSWTDAGPDASDSGSAWVDYALSAFSDVPGRTIERVSVADPPGTIGGETWESGAAIIAMDQSDGSGGASTPNATPAPQQVRIRVQVYATVHQGTPYIIAVYAADDSFATGNTQYFKPMLNTFAFLSTGSEP